MTITIKVTLKKHIALVFVLFALSVKAQDIIDIDLSNIPKGDDLKIGLVLSGGGAKGLAHIGVLKEIEKAGIEIDYIGGTSMGAIVGGLYASGYTASQLDSIFHAIDFQKLIQDQLPRSSKSFNEKKNSERYAITLPFDNFKVSIPSALSKGQNMYNLLAKLTMHVKDTRDFSKLPVPFFCIATDVVKGQAIVLDSGALPEAITASGALPSLFSPIDMDGRLLIDGGVLDNYPVEELRKRGANFIIGVDVQDDLKTREELGSAPEILVQVNNYRTIEAMKEKIKLTDIYIRPDIDDYSVVDFEKGNDIIACGEKKAQLCKAALEKVAQSQYAFYKKPKLKIASKDSITLKSIATNGNEYYTRSYILGKLKLRTPTTTTYDKLYQGINNLSATGNFKRINYSLEEYDDDSYHLGLNVRESKSTTSISAALHYDDLYKSAALVNFTKKRLLFRNDELSVDFVVGDNIRYNIDYFSDNGFYLGFGIRSSYNSFEKRIDADFVDQLLETSLSNLNSVDVEYSTFNNQFYLQTLFEKQFSLDLGIEHNYLAVETQTLRSDEADKDFVFEDNHYFSAYGKLELDTFDDKYFPTSGVYFNGDFHLYLLSSDRFNDFEEFSIGKAKFKYAFSPLKDFSAVISNEGGFKLGGNQTKSLDFILGGWGNNPVNNLIPFYGYDFVSNIANSYVMTTLDFDYNFYGKNHLTFGANIANFEDDLFSTGNWLSTPDYTGYYIGYGLETFLGPLQTRVTYSPEIDETHWHFSLGFWF